MLLHIIYQICVYMNVNVQHSHGRRSELRFFQRLNNDDMIVSVSTPITAVYWHIWMEIIYKRNLWIHKSFVLWLFLCQQLFSPCCLFLVFFSRPYLSWVFDLFANEICDQWIIIINSSFVINVWWYVCAYKAVYDIERLEISD